MDEQKQALEVLHGLPASKDEKGQLALLKNGFLPDDRDVLIEAGLRCVPLIGHDSSGEVEEAAIAHLQAIVARLILLSKENLARQAARNFEQEMGRYQKITYRNMMFGLLIIVVPVGLVVSLIAVVLYRWLTGSIDLHCAFSPAQAQRNF